VFGFQDFWFRVQGLELIEFRVQGSYFRAKDLKFSV
jgi:hypothetical protein